MGDWRRKIEDLLRKEFPAKFDELGRPALEPLPGHPHISAGYLTFYEWLGGMPDYDWRGYDRDLSNGVRLDVGRYLTQKKNHLAEIRDQLQEIQKWSTGRAVLDELGSYRFDVAIKPYFFFRAYGWNAVTGPADKDAARSRSCSIEPGSQQGSNSTVFYSAEMWEPYAYSADVWAPFAAGVNIKAIRDKKARLPGYRADEVLLHELAHAARNMGGLNCDAELDRYDNENEFFAILVANIYLSEKKRPLVRGIGDVETPLADATSESYMDHPQGRGVWARPLIDRFMKQQRTFFDRLAAIGYDEKTGTGAKYNPIRRYAEEDAAIRDHFRRLRNLGGAQPAN